MKKVSKVQTNPFLNLLWETNKLVPFSRKSGHLYLFCYLCTISIFTFDILSTLVRLAKVVHFLHPWMKANYFISSCAIDPNVTGYLSQWQFTVRHLYIFVILHFRQCMHTIILWFWILTDNPHRQTHNFADLEPQIHFFHLAQSQSFND